jgi:rare lipoprotein A
VALRRRARHRRSAARPDRAPRRAPARDRRGAGRTDARDRHPTWRLDPEISWYGPGFYGNGTACGQRYTETIMGVAHRSLPCGTLVSFKHRGVEITVPVIDRGPYVGGRIFDLSRAACKALNHCYTGPIYYKFP